MFVEWSSTKHIILDQPLNLIGGQLATEMLNLRKNILQ